MMKVLVIVGAAIAYFALTVLGPPELPTTAKQKVPSSNAAKDDENVEVSELHSAPSMPSTRTSLGGRFRLLPS